MDKLPQTEAEVLCPYPVTYAHRDINAVRHLASQGVDIAIITMAVFGMSHAITGISGHVPALQTEIVDLTCAVIFALPNDIPLDKAGRLCLSTKVLTLRSPVAVATELSIEISYDGLW